MSFHQIAHVYNRFTDLDIYEHWLDFTLSSLSREPERVLDMACGTGYFARLLAPFVKEIIGADIDLQMVEEARKESAKVPNAKFIQADMTNFASFNKKFDVITCYLDSLCFLPDYTALESAFKEFYTALNNQGVLLFDVWTPYQINVGFEGFNYFDQDDTAALLWRSENNSSNKKVMHELTLYELEPGTKLYQRKTSKLYERTYTLEKYIKALNSAGFPLDQIEVLVDYGSQPYEEGYGDQTDRWFFRCYK